MNTTGVLPDARLHLGKPGATGLRRAGQLQQVLGSPHCPTPSTPGPAVPTTSALLPEPAGQPNSRLGVQDWPLKVAATKAEASRLAHSTLCTPCRPWLSQEVCGHQLGNCLFTLPEQGCAPPSRVEMFPKVFESDFKDRV